MAALGLRGKSLLALMLSFLLAIGLAALVGREALHGVQNRFGEDYARNIVQLNRERLYAPVSRELALAQRLADSQITRAWLKNEDDAEARALFFREAAGYQRAFSDHAYFAASAQSGGYYSNGDNQPFSDTSRYVLSPTTEADSWFYATLDSGIPHRINVDRSVISDDIKVWFNIVVVDGERPLGLVGSGISLNAFVEEFIAANEAGVESMVLDARGSILVHPDQDLVTLNAETSKSRSLGTNLFGLMDSAEASGSLREMFAASTDSPGEVFTMPLKLEGEPRLLALTWVPELQWFVASAVDLRTAQVIEIKPLIPALGIFLALFLAMITLGAWAVERRVLKPLRQLRKSAQAIAAGQYDAPLPLNRNDEIGELGAAFRSMAQQVRAHTSELEARVLARTGELQKANDEMRLAHKKIDDSIDYASLIQHAILPKRELVQALGDRHMVLWQPRDVVGGDFYVYRASDQGCLLGVVDCAGHGVPGALMTMLAHAAIDQAITDIGLSDPAAILARTDRIVRSTLRDGQARHALATNMDVGLVYLDFERRVVTFAGAKIALYFSDGEALEELPAARRAIGDRRPGEYTNARIALQAGRTFYLTTDGFLDQAGGDQGYGFGNRRFAEMILRHARLPLDEQREAFSATLAEYQGDFPQRDDITLLCFRFD